LENYWKELEKTNPAAVLEVANQMRQYLLKKESYSDFIEDMKSCTFCRLTPGRLQIFFSHGNQRVDRICSPCTKKLGKPKVQAILEDLPFPQKKTNFFKK